MERIVQPEPARTEFAPEQGRIPGIPDGAVCYVWAGGGVFSATALFWLLRGLLDSGQASLLYLPIVIACAVRFGFKAAVLAALLSFLCWDYFFLPPLHALNVANPHDLISLVIFLIAAVTTGRLAAHARSKARDAQARLRETVVLYQASHVISHEIDSGRMLSALVDHVVSSCQASACVIVRGGPQSHGFQIVHAAGNLPVAPDQERLILQTAASVAPQRTLVRSGASPNSITVPLLMNEHSFGVMHVSPRRDARPFSSQEERLILTLANHAAIVIARQLQEARVREQAGQAAVLEERNRLANDIHDTLSHAFTGIKFLLEAALRLGSSPQSVECVAQARTLAIEGAQEARRSVLALRPAALEERGLIPAIQALAEQRTRGTSVTASVVVHGAAQPLSEAMDEHLLRICQEALTNILRHAQPSRIEIALTFQETRVVLSVKDDGCGFLVSEAKSRNGFGLISMRERAERIGGRLDVSSRLGEGTTVLADVPLPRTSTHLPTGIKHS